MITYLRKQKGTLTLMSLKTNIHSFIYQTYPGIFSCAAAVGFVVDIPYHKNYLVSRRGWSSWSTLSLTKYKCVTDLFNNLEQMRKHTYKDGQIYLATSR